MQGKHYLLTAGLICTSVLLNVTMAQADQVAAQPEKIQSVQQFNSSAAPVANQNAGSAVLSVPTSQMVGQSQAASVQPSSASQQSSSVSTSVTSKADSVAASSQAKSSATSDAQSVSATIQSVQSQATSAESTDNLAKSQAVSAISAVSSQAKVANSTSSAAAGVTLTTSNVAANSVVSQAVVPSPKVGPGEYDGAVANGIQRYSNTSDFLNEIKPGALDGWHQYQVLPSITAAQAILESGWGNSQLSKLGNNLFGIKGDYNGNSVTYPTKEFVNGHYEVVNAAFRQYPTQSASISDHGAFLNVNSRYRNLLNQRDYHTVAKLLQQDGYATDPHYAELLVLLIEQNGLASWDQSAFNGQNLPVTQPEQPANNPEQAIQGQYTFKTATSIYTKPDFQADVVGEYQKGEKVNYIGQATIAGTKWFKYLSYSGKIHYVPVATVAKPVVEAVTGQYRFSSKTTIHEQPNGISPSIGYYAAGETVYFNGKVQIDNQTWLRYQAYSGKTHYVLMSTAHAIPEVRNANGTHLFSERTDIRTSPDWQAPVVGQYWTGETVYYNGKVTIDGTTWLRYLAQSGQTHYVPMSVNDHSMVTTKVRGNYQFGAWTAIHTAPTTSTSVVGYYGRGETVYYVAKVTVNGQTWLKYLANSGQYHYVQMNSQTVSEQGNFTFKTTTNIRLSAGLNGQIVGQYYPGETVYYVGKIWADGYTWLKYLARDGRYHYTAVVN